MMTIIKLRVNSVVQGLGKRDINIDTHDICYIRWNSMLQRCYSSECQIRNKTYVGCTVCEEWLLFSNFKQWFDENYIEGYELDKDILVEGNKVYSPDTCRFVPSYINTLLVQCNSARGDLPLGVTRNNKSYMTQCSNSMGIRVTKTFKTIPEAQSWYSETKKQVVKEQATRAFLDNAIKTDVYLALVRREF